MFTPLSQVILVGNQRPRPSDPIVYIRERPGNEPIFTLDDGPEQRPNPYAGTPKRYGVAYLDASENYCIIPDAWSEGDARGARLAIWPRG